MHCLVGTRVLQVEARGDRVGAGEVHVVGASKVNRQVQHTQSRHLARPADSIQPRPRVDRHVAFPLAEALALVRANPEGGDPAPAGVAVRHLKHYVPMPSSRALVEGQRPCGNIPGPRFVSEHRSGL